MGRAGRPGRRGGKGGEVPGKRGRIAAIVADAGANIEEVHHKRAFTLLAAQNVTMELVVQARGREHTAQVIACLRADGFDARLV